MTRQELANLLLADKDKLNEEVMIIDMEYGRYYPINSIKSITIAMCENGDYVEQYISKKGRVYPGRTNERVVTEFNSL